MSNLLFDRKMQMAILFAVATASCTPSEKPSLSKSICIEANAECFQVIKKGAELPVSFSTEFSNIGNDSVSVNVYQGESSKTKENLLIGEFTVPIKASKAGDAQVQVTISVDEKKNLAVTAQDLKTGEVKKFQGGLVK